MTFEQARGAYPVLARVAYLNAGTFGPLSTGVAAAVEAEQRRDLEEGRYGKAWFERVAGLRDGVRRRIARLVGAAPEQVALTASTTDGCNIVLAGLGLEPGDEVVTTTHEHPGLDLPLDASPATVVRVEPDPDAILAAVTPRTRLLALSQVLWTTGALLPVRELRERSGLPVLVDGAQSVGAVPVEARGIDFLTVSGQKWLCGPDSTGALVVADPERLAAARPSFFALLGTGALRLEPNWLSAGTLAGLRVALDEAPAWRFERAAAQAARCRALLEPLVDVVPGGATLVSFRPQGEDPAGLVARLDGAGVVVRDIADTGLVRASVGWWTSDDDLDRLAAALLI